MLVNAIDISNKLRCWQLPSYHVALPISGSWPAFSFRNVIHQCHTCTFMELKKSNGSTELILTISSPLLLMHSTLILQKLLLSTLLDASFSISLSISKQQILLFLNFSILE